MRQVCIIEGNRYALVSYGNGFAYHLQMRGHPQDNGVYVEGDDATTFRNELDMLETAHPYWHVDDILARLHHMYTP